MALAVLSTVPLQAGAEAASDPGSQTFFYTGHPETYVVPDDVHYVNIDAGGGRGGNGHTKGPGGLGIEVHASYVAVTPGEHLRVVVGGNGFPSVSVIHGGVLAGAAGYNGGGDGTRGAGGGGGFSYVQGSDGRHLVIAAGGGGGAGESVAGGPRNPPGTLNGADGSGATTPQGGGGGTLGGGGYGGHNSNPIISDGKGGFRFGGGAGGAGLEAKIHAGGGGGGGGGYYGGGGGAGSEVGSGGAGGAGSSYIYPHVIVDTATHPGAGSVTITPDPTSGHATQYSLVPASTTLTAGSTYGFTIVANDASGHRDADYRGTVHFEGSREGSLPQDYTFTADDHGLHVFRSGIRYLKATSDLSVTATDVKDSSITGTIRGLKVVPSSLARVSIVPTWMVVNHPQTLRVAAYDEFDNRLPDVTTEARKWLIQPEANCSAPSATPSCLAHTVDQAGSTHLVTVTMSNYNYSQQYTVSSSAPTTGTRTDVGFPSASTTPTRGGHLPLEATVTQLTPQDEELGSPTGTVSFYDGTIKLGSAPVIDQGGVYKAAIDAKPPFGGRRTVRAVYEGNLTHRTSEGSGPVWVSPNQTKLTLTSSANPAPAGTQPSFVVKVSAGTEPVKVGSIIVTADGNPSERVIVPAAEADTPFHFAQPLSPGKHQIEAFFEGTDDYYQTTSQIDQEILGEGRQPSVVVVASNTHPEVAEPVTFTATVSASGSSTPPQGTVRFDFDGRPVGSPVPVSNGQATTRPIPIYPIGSRPTGRFDLTASYLPGSGYQASTGTLAGGLNVESAKTTTTVTVTPDHTKPGQPVALSARVSAKWTTPEGFVYFAIDGSPLSDRWAVINGMATVEIRPGFYGDRLTPGSHSLTARFLPYNASVTESSGAAQEQVGSTTQTKTVVTSSNAQSLGGEPVTFSAAVTVPGTSTVASGQVQFAIDGHGFGPPVILRSGLAQSQSTNALSIGQHQVTATFEDQSYDFLGSNGELDGYQTVRSLPTTTAVTSSVNPYTLGTGDHQVVFVMHVSAAEGVPTGTMAFSLGDLNYQPALVNGVATVVVSDPTLVFDVNVPGTYEVRASYQPDSARYQGSSGALSQRFERHP